MNGYLEVVGALATVVQVVREDIVLIIFYKQIHQDPSFQLLLVRYLNFLLSNIVGELCNSIFNLEYLNDFKFNALDLGPVLLNYLNKNFLILSKK